MVSLLFSVLGAVLLTGATSENSRAVGAVVLGVGLNHSLRELTDGRQSVCPRATS